MLASNEVTIEQARAVQSFSPAPWTISQTTNGWSVKLGTAQLVLTNGRKPRIFKSIDGAVRRLKEEVGALQFLVETLP